jgi:hypothetical protein
VKTQLGLDPYEEFDDYLEMVIQYGYIVIFAGNLRMHSEI